MNSLEQFLALPDVDNITAEVFVSERLGKFTVKAMTAEDYREYQRKAGGTAIGKKGKLDFDTTKFFISMVAGQTIEPNFGSKEVLTKCGCALAEQVVSKKLLMGEIMRIANKIQEISGFGDNIEEDIDEAKN